MAHKTSEDFRVRYGPWALVAGASEGLGAEFAAQLAARGLNLVLLARRAVELEAVSARLRDAYAVEVRAVPLDLAREDLAGAVSEATGDVEIGLLVYNAALSRIGPYFETSLEDHLREIAINCRAPMMLAYLLGQPMLKRGHGGILLMSSLGGAQGSALLVNYTATKAYNRLLAEGLWDELRTQGVDVLNCCPPAVSTPGYLASAPKGAMSALTPQAVASAALAALAKGPTIIPGWNFRLANLIMQRVLPRKTTIKLMGRITRGMYQ
ncbi:MAG TPA: SDR family NAD(P)-dependent oxidoreductase [Ktedonobacteraceae bacterium]